MRNRQIETQAFSRPRYLLTTAIAALAFSACAIPQSPEVVGLRLTRFTPGASKGDKVMVPIELKVINPNEEQLEIRAKQIRIVTKEGETERTLGVASFETPVIVGPGKKGEKKPQLVETTLGVDRESWDRSIFKNLRSGNAYVTGPVEVLYKGSTYKTTLDIKLPGRDDPNTDPGQRILAIEFKLEEMELDFRSLTDLGMVAKLAATSEIGQAITLKDVTMTIGAEKSAQPLNVKLNKDVELPADKSSMVSLSGDADLSKCDTNLLDDIEKDGRKAIITLKGTAVSEGFPETDFDEKYEMSFEGGENAKAPKIEIKRPPIALFSEVIGASEQSSSVINGLKSVASLANFKPTPVSFSLNNPIPGTMTIETSQVILLGPYNPDRKKRLEIVSLNMENQEMQPRSKSDVQATMSLMKDGKRTWKAVAVDASNSKLSDYCLASTFTLKLPVFGSIKSEKSFGPVYSNSKEDCSIR